MIQQELIQIARCDKCKRPIGVIIPELKLGIRDDYIIPLDNDRAYPYVHYADKNFKAINAIYCSACFMPAMWNKTLPYPINDKLWTYHD